MDELDYLIEFEHHEQLLLNEMENESMITIRIGQTWRTKDGTHVDIISKTGDRFMVGKDRWQYAVDADGRTIFQSAMRRNEAGDLDVRMPRVYVAGPMTGIEALNFPAFHARTKLLRDRGAHVENPAEINPDPHMDWHEAMRRDIPRLLTCDTIDLLPGWEKSRGATLEYHIAQQLGMTIIYPES